MGDFIAWAEAVAGYFWAFYTGVVVVVLGAAERIFQRLGAKFRWTSTAAIILGCLLMLYASFLAWRDQKVATDSATAALQTQEITNGDLSAQLTDQNTPNFQVSLQNVWMFPQGKYYQLYMILDVRNTGAPSIIDYWEVYAANRDHRSILLLTLHRFDSQFSFPTVYGRMTYKPSYWLPDRTLPNPVPRGADVKGVLIALLSPSVEKKVDLRSLGITFNDVNGDTHRAAPSFYTINSAAVSPPTLDR
jgi:hypothetical protein